MAKLEKFEDIEAWKLARALTTKIYLFAGAGDFARDHGFRDQICRAAVSIVSNIAEGFERKSDKAFLQFLTIAKGSAGELRAQLYVALDLGYISKVQFSDAYSDVMCISKMISRLMSYLSRPSRSSDLRPSTTRPSTRTSHG